MIGIVGVVAVLTVLGLSLLITRLATVALTMTGLSQDVARFQARSAFTGTGFTTAEAEKVVAHPVRRRIIMLLMIVRSAGIISIIISLILSFVGAGADIERLYRLLYLLGGVAVLWLLSISKWVERGLDRLIRWALGRWTDLEVQDYVGLLHLSGDYQVTQLRVRDGDWLAGKTVADCDLHQEGVAVLGIIRDGGRYLGAPRATSDICAGDTLVLYGRRPVLQQLDERRKGASGDIEHAQAVRNEEQHAAAEQRQDEEAQDQRAMREAGD